MKTILLLATIGMGCFNSSSELLASENSSEIPTPFYQNYVEEKSENQEISFEKNIVRIHVEYIVAENNKNYVIFIKSDHPEIHQKIIRMISNMPVDPAAKNKKHNLVIEYEL